MASKKKTAKKVAKKVTKKAAKKVAKKVAKKAPKKQTAKKTASKPKASKKAQKEVGASAAVKTLKKSAPPTEFRTVKSVELKGFTKKQYQKLLDLRDSILDVMHGVTNDTLKNSDSMESGGGGMHTGDAGSDAYDRDFALNLLAMEQDSLSEIEKAITRIETGVYGVCEMSGEKIPNVRLEAIPFARYTVQCQAAWEKDNGNGRHRAGETFSFSSSSMR